MTCSIVANAKNKTMCEEKWSNVIQYWSNVNGACESTRGLVKDTCKLTCGNCDG